MIWGSTTPVCPEGEKLIKIKADKVTEAKYLAAALRVKKKHNVHVNDLNAFMYSKWETYKIAANNVHYNKAGYKALAEQETIKSQLK